MPAFGKRRTGPGRWLSGPRKSIRATIVLQMQRPRGLSGGQALFGAGSHVIIGTSGDATGAQRDTGGSMSADHGRQAESAVSPELSASEAEPSASRAQPSASEAQLSGGQARPSAGQAQPLYGGHATQRLTIRDLAAAKARGEKWPMLTAYDALTAAVFDSAGIPVLLVGDSAAMVVYGHDSTIPVTVDDLIPLTQAVVRGTRRALVVADLPFGSYQASPAAALETATRFLKETGAQAVKLEGGYRVVRQVEELVAAGIPVMAHLGLTPQSVNAFGGYRVQGRGEDGDRLLHDAKALEAAGAFSVVLEAIPADLAAKITAAMSIPTIGIGAGPDCDAQVLVWQDMAGLTPRTARFVKRYADVAGVLSDAARSFAEEVVSGQFPDEEHSYN